jgi:hypothetical protein
MSEENAPQPMALPERTWHPLVLEPRTNGWQVQVGFFPSPSPRVEPARPIHFGHLWLSSAEAAPGETLHLRVRLHSRVPLHLRDFSVMLVGVTPAPPRGLSYADAAADSRDVLHSELVMMHTNRVLPDGEVLELPLERVTLPQNGLTAGNPDMRWYLKVEARLENRKELFLQNIQLHARPLLQSLQQPLPRWGEEEHLPRAPSPVSTDIRRKLEVGIETLEGAHARYALLDKALHRKQWQQAVRERVNTLQELVRREPEIDEALARLHQRAQVEGWPEEEPALGLARKVERLRSRLKAITNERLRPPAAPEGGLAERLTSLDRFLARALAPPLSPEELVLHQGEFSQKPPLAFLLLFGTLMALFSCAVITGTARAWALYFAPALVLSYLWHRLERECLGRFWLTGKRLVWKPRGGVAIHIPLDAIRPGGVRILRFQRVGMELVDGRFVHLGFTEDAEQFVSLLEQHALDSRPKRLGSPAPAAPPA